MDLSVVAYSTTVLLILWQWRAIKTVRGWESTLYREKLRKLNVISLGKKGQGDGITAADSCMKSC